MGSQEAFHGDGPGDIYAEQRTGTRYIHRPSFESRNSQRQRRAADETPARNADVDFGLDYTVGNVDHVQEVTQVVSGID